MKRKWFVAALSPGFLAIVLVGLVVLSTASNDSAVLSVNTQTVNPNVNLDQWANLPGQGWQNGNLNGNNSAYAEGRVVPFRLALEGLSAGQHSIHINYDFTTAGHEAYDFLATYNATESGVDLCASGGGAVSSMCPSLPTASTVAFPSDSFAPGGNTKAGLTVSGAQSSAGVGRNLTLYGASGVSMTGPTHSGSTSSDSTGDFLVTFNTANCPTSGCAVLFAWGGHLAQSAYWVTPTNGPNGASQISGAPWHMRTQQLDGSGNKNQDRSIQPSALQAPTATPTATATATNTSTATPTSTPTSTSTATPTMTMTATPTSTSTSTPTMTPTATTPPNPTTPPEGPTNTPVPPTNTPVPPTNTPAPPTATTPPSGGDNTAHLCIQDASGNWTGRTVTKPSAEYDQLVGSGAMESGTCPSNPAPAPTNPPAPAATAVPAVAGQAPPPVPPTVAPAPPAPAPPAPPEVAGEQPVPVPAPMPQRLPNTGEAGEAGLPVGWIMGALLLLTIGITFRRAIAPARARK